MEQKEATMGVRDKVISAFTLSSSGPHMLHLDDAPHAVAVTPNDGTLVFNEGSTEGRLDGVAIKGSSVRGFFLTRDRGHTVVAVDYRRGQLIETYRLGVSADEASAEAWVNRVNQIYERARNLEDERSEEFRTGRFLKSPVVHDVLATRSNRVLPGDYLCLPGEDLSRGFSTDWQIQYVERCVVHLKEFADFREDIENVWLTPTEHSYDYIADRIRYTRESFEVRVTQPLEMIFDREQRHEKVRVIPLARVTCFAIVCRKKHFAFEELASAREIPAGETFSAWLEKIAETESREDWRIVFGTLASTSADYLLRDAQMFGYLGWDQRVPMPNVSTLADWLHEKQSRVIACDIGVAKHVIHELEKISNGRSWLELLPVPYDKPVPVGIPYRADDEQWGAICRRALIDCLESSDERILKSFDETRERAAAVGVEWAAAA